MGPDPFYRKPLPLYITCKSEGCPLLTIMVDLIKKNLLVHEHEHMILHMETLVAYFVSRTLGSIADMFVKYLKSEVRSIFNRLDHESICKVKSNYVSNTSTLAVFV